MTNDADAFRIGLGKMGESVVAIGRDVSQKMKRLALGSCSIRFASVATGRSDRQGDETPTG